MYSEVHKERAENYVRNHGRSVTNTGRGHRGSERLAGYESITDCWIGKEESDAINVANDVSLPG